MLLDKSGTNVIKIANNSLVLNRVHVTNKVTARSYYLTMGSLLFFVIQVFPDFFCNYNLNPSARGRLLNPVWNMRTIEILTPRGHLRATVRVLLRSGRLKLVDAEFVFQLKMWTLGSNRDSANFNVYCHFFRDRLQEKSS